MYFIKQGLVRVVRETADLTQPWKSDGGPHALIVGSLRDGSFFGEVALVSPNGTRRACSVISSSVRARCCATVCSM